MKRWTFQFVDKETNKVDVVRWSEDQTDADCISNKYDNDVLSKYRDALKKALETVEEYID